MDYFICVFLKCQVSRVEQAQGHNYLISYLWKVALIIQYM